MALTAIRPAGTDTARLRSAAIGAVIDAGKAIRSIMRYVAMGPRLGSKKRRNVRRLLLALVLVGVASGAAWLSLRVVARDLVDGRHIHAKHTDEAKVQAEQAVARPSASVILPGGPAASAVPVRNIAAPAMDPVAQALLAAGRDHLARKVAASSLPVEDSRANKGSGIDLIDRGLERILSLRQALPRHRARAPQLYGLRDKPAITGDEQRRALTAENLQVFLTTFAQTLDGTRENLEAGDIVLLERKRGVRRLLPAVVSDVVDNDGMPMVITLDPVDRVAREQALTPYALVGHFRLHRAEVERLRASLEMPSQAVGALL